MKKPKDLKEARPWEPGHPDGGQRMDSPRGRKLPVRSDARDDFNGYIREAVFPANPCPEREWSPRKVKEQARRQKNFVHCTARVYKSHVILGELKSEQRCRTNKQKQIRYP